jgi:hypothetical protein
MQNGGWLELIPDLPQARWQDENYRKRVQREVWRSTNKKPPDWAGGRCCMASEAMPFLLHQKAWL